jgi:hypothetical protein
LRGRRVGRTRAAHNRLHAIAPSGTRWSPLTRSSSEGETKASPALRFAGDGRPAAEGRVPSRPEVDREGS